MHASSPSSSLTRRAVLILALASLASLAGYVLVSAFSYEAGFPLDDTWIHLTYARNLGEHREWAFKPGIPSAGSTSPLWTVLLSIGYTLGLMPYLWPHALGALLLFGLAFAGERIARVRLPRYRPAIPWIGLFLAVEWHLVWAAASGMETLLHALLVTVVIGMLSTGTTRFVALGLLAGVSIWVRPDGITLMGPVIVYALLQPDPAPARLRKVTVAVLGCAALVSPYLLFNLVLGGSPFPNTFYAKQAEYTAWQALPWLSRLGQLGLQFSIGPGLVVFPGAALWLWNSVRRRSLGDLLGMAWFSGYLVLYLSRLPVYQHARYLMPAMPAFFLWGLMAFFEFAALERDSALRWRVRTGWSWLILILGAAFWAFGARAYARDVAFIQSEMVVSAKWVAENVPAGQLVAAHDIGALGYFDDHPLLDLAGLVSPEVIPFLRDEDRLADYLDARNVSYLVAFPEFYPQLSRMARPVFRTGGAFAPMLGGENMVVYRWR